MFPLRSSVGVFDRNDLRRSHTDLSTHHRSRDLRNFPFVVVPPNVLFLEVMLRLLKCWDTDDDALLIAGFAGGVLGMAGLGTWRGGLFGASICAVSASLGITRSASRSDDRVKSLESAIEVCVTDFAKFNGRFS